MKFVKGILFAILFCFACIQVNTGHAQVFSTKASHALLMDVGSGTILLDKNAGAQTKPASMTKVLTLAVVFDALAKGEIALHDTVSISENAWRKGGANSGGSTMFAELGSDVSIENLIWGIAVQSGNDACIAIAEGMAGTEAAFVQRMNAFAKSIGMTNSNFTNTTGLPDDAQYTTARDLAKLGVHVIDTYPDLYKLYSEPEFTWNNIRQFNRNPLLKQGIGGDGIKTGFTEESGYGLLGSAVDGKRRLLLVINGLESRRARAEEAKKILHWGFRSFQTVELFEKGEVIGQANVFGGTERKVDVVSTKPVQLLLPKGEYGRIRAQIVYNGPLRAPLEAGVEVGTLIVKIDGEEKLRQQVYTDENIGIGSLQQRALDALYELTIGQI